MKLNENFKNLENNYLFATIAEKVNKFTKENPSREIIRLGIGDVTLPLTSSVVNSLVDASKEQGEAANFRGYGEYAGYSFLREAIANYYVKKGANIDANEVYAADGAKNDISNILDLFSKENTVLVPDPVYPVYVDTNIMDGREIIYANASEENGFLPMPDKNQKADLIYICSPNNPTGAVYTKKHLEEWVSYAKENDAIILFDSAYEAFVSDDSLPTSIFEISGAETCAIEFGSFSKMAGFTGLRASYCIIKKELERGGMNIGEMWLRRQSTKYNGLAYIVQRAAQAALSDEGQLEIKENIKYYKENSEIITKTLDELNIFYTGGKNAAFVWLKCPENFTSWSFFDYLLEEAGVVGTPGAGFGKMGEGYFRLSAFGNREKTIKAMANFKEAILKISK